MVVKTTPGHTPGHQVLFVKLPKTGPVVLAGDLYHYPEELTTGKIADLRVQRRASPRHRRAKIEAFVKQTGAQLWIEHDIATHANLPKAPAFSNSGGRVCDALPPPRRLRRRVGATGASART